MKKMILAAALFAATLCLNSQAQAAYSVPLQWMPMNMLNVSFTGDASNGVLSVVNPTANAQLYTNTYNNMMMGSGYGTNNGTAASFDPTKPWSVLNGTAFSRLFGWYDPTTPMGSASSGGMGTLGSTIATAYGTGANIWIQQTAASAGLKTYQAIGKFGVNIDNSQNPAVGGYDPIFGTAGSSTKWKWDYMMDHNTYAVSLSDIVANQVLSATYKVYVGDGNGNEILNTNNTSAATTETWNFQAPAVMPTPIPAAAWLLGSGLMGLVGLRRKNRG